MLDQQISERKGISWTTPVAAVSMRCPRTLRQTLVNSPSAKCGYEDIPIAGTITDAHERDSNDCRFLSPATSTQSGPMVYGCQLQDPDYEYLSALLTIQNTPTMAPQSMAKKIVSPNEVAGSQKTKQDRPQSSVRAPAVSIRLDLSLRIPIIGRPIAVPTCSKPTMSVACDRDKPIDSAKSAKENRSRTYPSILMKAQARSSSTSYRRRSLVSKPSCLGRIALFLSRMMAIATTSAAKAMTPVMRRAQLIPHRRMMASVP